jgi:hypothetical protein
MSAATGLHDDTAHRPVCEERHELCAFENLAVHRAGLRFEIVNFENALGQVDGNDREFYMLLLGRRDCRISNVACSGRDTAALGGPARRKATIPFI